MRLFSFIFLFSITLQAGFWSDYEMFARYMGYERNYEKAIKQSKKEHKDLLILYVSEGCPFCHKTIEKILTKKSVREYIDKHYIKLLINRDTDKGKYPQKYYRPFTPVTYIIDPKSEQIMDEIDGWMEEDYYLWHL